jgi:hypothetical protein
VLFTIPYRSIMIPDSPFMEVITGFIGGTASAVGASSSQTAYTAKGSLHGGAAGLLTAVIGTTTIVRGTVGTGVSAAPNVVVLEKGATIRWDLIASQYAVGAGFLHMAFRTIG